MAFIVGFYFSKLFQKAPFKIISPKFTHNEFQ